MPQFLSIQYLRAIAATLVVAFHASIMVRRDYAPDFAMWKTGEFGVDIFFVISGFIMWMIAASRPTTPGDFIEKRIIRIVPLYWVLTLFTVFISTEGGLHVVRSIDWTMMAKSLFFVPAWNEKGDLVAPMMSVGWTLNLEMFFYAIFAASLALKPKARLIAIVTILMAFASMRLFMGASPHPALNLYTNSVVGEFAFGVLLAALFGPRLADAASKPGLKRLAFALVTLGATAPFFREHLTDARIIHFGLPALALVSGALLLEGLLARRPVRALKFLGDASYSIYLVHFMAQAVSLKIIGPALGASAPVLAVLAMTVCGVAAGCLLHLVIEKPLTRSAGSVARALHAAFGRKSAPALAPR